MKIKIEDSVGFLTKIVENKIASTTHLLIEAILDAMIEFKSDYAIINCSDEPDDDADELLAEFGIFENWDDDDNNSYFEFSFTRQVLLKNNEEFYQITVNVVYDQADFIEVDGGGFWSMDYTNIQDWEKEVKTTQAYHIAKQSDSIKYKISLNMT
ncbi:hypothetical protein WAF17_14610 [Bernardetia sp. ABR2-2B]|uniref:hypothetical protein n=1 Tax=Bernardetia sp. ABR2-2B TaxID=3127472 RepID=UPI0030D2945B